jgi:AcrR family transcriptional regulator
VVASVRTQAPLGRRDLILQAAAELFAQRGFHGVSIDDLGAAAGIAGPGVYRHFRSKDAVLGELLLTVSEDLLSGAQQRLEFTDPEHGLEVLVAAHVQFAVAHPSLITLQAHDLDSLNEVDRRRVRRLQRQYLEVWVSTLRATSEVDQETALAAVHAVIGLINSTPHSARTDDATRMLHAMALAALGAATSLD